MSILDKRPAPWRLGKHRDVIVDATCEAGAECFEDGRVAGVTSSEDIAFASSEVERLILAAPVLLACVRAFVSDDCPRDLTPFNVLLSNIEGDGECSPIDAPAFLAWLGNRGPAPRDGGKVEDATSVRRERDELLAALKECAQIFSTEGPQNILPLRSKVDALIARLDKAP
jgi:hypothetical protein